MQTIGKTLRTAQLSKDAMAICLASLAPSTTKQYSSHIRSFIIFCQSNHILDFTTIQVETGIEYLTTLYNRGMSYSTINSARSALSQFVELKPCKTQNFGNHPLTVKFMRGVFKLRTPKPKYSSIWDVSIVLAYLRTIDNKKCSLKDLTLKSCMLLALCTGQRVQTLAAFMVTNIITDANSMTFIVDSVLKTTKPGTNNTFHICRYTPDLDICPVITTEAYIQRTADLRAGERQLLLSYRKPYKPVTSQSISRWIVQILKYCNINSCFTAHSTRSAATSKAALHTDINTVLRMAGWSTDTTFALYYNKPVERGQSFVNAVLH